MKQKKILVINTIGLNFEGITTVIYNYLSEMDQQDLLIDVYAPHDTNSKLISKFENVCNLIYGPRRNKKMLPYIQGLLKILNNDYDVIHVHGNSGTMFVEALLARLKGVKKVIVHCHNTKTNHPVLNTLLKSAMMIFSDELMACSIVSGEWLYGEKKFTVLKNAIDISKFKFSEETRLKYREEFNFTNEFIIGHVGHFSDQKNHVFLVDVFNAFHSIYPNSKLLLISDGPNFQKIKNKVEALGLSSSVVFVGRRDDIHNIYNAMDVFVIPSLWEGLSLVTVEAQANGLSVIASEAIPKEAACTQNVYYTSIESVEDWKNRLLTLVDKERDLATFNDVQAHGYDIKLESDKLKNIYLK